MSALNNVWDSSGTPPQVSAPKLRPPGRKTQRIWLTFKIKHPADPMMPPRPPSVQRQETANMFISAHLNLGLMETDSDSLSLVGSEPRKTKGCSRIRLKLICNLQVSAYFCQSWWWSVNNNLIRIKTSWLKYRCVFVDLTSTHRLHPASSAFPPPALPRI